MPDPMTDQTPTDTPQLTGVALISTEPPTGLRITHGRIPTADLPRLRAAVDSTRTAALGLAYGEWADITLIVGRHNGGRPQPEVLTARPEDVDALRALVLELDR